VRRPTAARLTPQFFDNCDLALPVIHWPELRMSFELAGRTLSQLPGIMEALLGCVIVQAARTSQSPLLLIHDGDRVVRNEQFCSDLTQVRLRRTDAV